MRLHTPNSNKSIFCGEYPVQEYGTGFTTTTHNGGLAMSEQQ